MRYSGVLLLTDLDGTFLNDDVKTVKANIDAVNKFTSEGGLFSVASGRPPASAFQYINECKVNFPAITFNGAMIYDFEKQKAEMVLNPTKETADTVFEIYRKFNEKYPDKIGFLGYYEKDLIAANSTRYSLLMKPFEKLNFKIETDLNNFPFPAVKYIFVSEPEIVNELLSELSTHSDKFRTTSPGKYFAEILKIGADKGSAMEKALKSRKDEIKTVVAIGDYFNDLCILEKADVKVVVKGSPKELTDFADYVTQKSNNEGAVADLIEHLEEILSEKAR